MEKEKFCKTCIHFIQHYRKANKKYCELHCGHCIYPRIKKRTADEKSCAHYEEIPEHTKNPLHQS